MSQPTILILLNKPNTGPSFGYPLLAKEFEKKGFKAVLIHFYDPDFENILQTTISENNVLFVLSHNNLAADYKINGEYFYDKFRIHYITLTDTPLNKFHLFENTGKNVAFLLGDYRFKSLVDPVTGNKPYFEWYGYNNYFEEKENRPIAERQVDILFPGRVGEEDKKIEQYSWREKRLARFIADRYQYAANEYQIHELLPEICQQAPWYLRSLAKKIDLKNKYHWEFLWSVSHMIRTRRREFVLAEVLALPENYKVTIITDKPVAEKLRNTVKKNVEVADFMPWPNVIAMMRDTKIVINTLPFQIQSHHERIATAQFCGCAVFSDANVHLKTEYVNGESIVFYDYEKGMLAGLLKKYLDEQKQLHTIAQAGYVISSGKNMPANRIDYILSVYQKISNNKTIQLSNV